MPTAQSCPSNARKSPCAHQRSVGDPVCRPFLCAQPHPESAGLRAQGLSPPPCAALSLDLPGRGSSLEPTPMARGVFGLLVALGMACSSGNVIAQTIRGSYEHLYRIQTSGEMSIDIRARVEEQSSSIAQSQLRRNFTSPDYPISVFRFGNGSSL